MGTRLYPNHVTPELLERLSGVPQGTYERLIAVDDKYPLRHAMNDQGFEQGQAHYDEIDANDALNALENMRVFGWGRLTPSVSVIIRDMGEYEYSGRVMALAQIQRILDAQGVNLHDVDINEIEGVRWG